MYKVKAWAHDTAHKSNFNPWANEKSEAPSEPAPLDEESPNGPPEKPKKTFVRRIVDDFKAIIFRSWLNLFLVFVPAGFIVHFAGVDKNVDFAVNAVAIIPLAGLLTFATEQIAFRSSVSFTPSKHVPARLGCSVLEFVMSCRRWHPEFYALHAWTFGEPRSTRTCLVPTVKSSQDC